MGYSLRAVGCFACLLLPLSCTTPARVPAPNYQDSTFPEAALDLFDIPPQPGETTHPSPESVATAVERVVPPGKLITLVAVGTDPEGVRRISITWQSLPECRRTDGSIIARGKPTVRVSNEDSSSFPTVAQRLAVSTSLRLTDGDSECGIGETFVRHKISVYAEAENWVAQGKQSARAALIYPGR